MNVASVSLSSTLCPEPGGEVVRVMLMDLGFEVATDPPEFSEVRLSIWCTHVCKVYGISG